MCFRCSSNLKFREAYNEKNGNWHLFLCYCRYFDKSFTEIFLELSCTNHMNFLQIADFDWWPWQPKDYFFYWWAYSIGMVRRPSYVVHQHFKTSSPLKPLGQLKPNFIWSLYGMGERKFVQMVQVTWPRWPPCPYMIKILKNFFSGTKRPMTFKHGM